MNISLITRNKWVVIILAFALVIRLVRVDLYPAGLFGDVIEHLRMAQSIHIVRWAGDGPLFPLIATFTTRLWGFRFLSLKLTSIAISILGIFATIQYSRALTHNKEIALITGALMAISFWDISMSHQGKPYAFIPLFTALIGYFLLKKDFLKLGISIGLALYTQAAAWGVYVLSFLSPLSALVAGIVGIPFFWEIITKPQDFFSTGSHIGEKLALTHISQSPLISLFIVGSNLLKQTLALFMNGENGFRSTIPGQAHLDEITAFFLGIGIIIAIATLIRESRKQSVWSVACKYLWPYGVCFLLLGVFIQLPAALDIHNPQGVPNHGRTIGLLPLACTGAAFGIWSVGQSLEKISIHNRIRLAALFSVIVLVGAGIINLYRYWVIYPLTLPNHNTPFAEIISYDVMHTIPKKPVVILNCCWGEWGQPEVGAFDFLDPGPDYYIRTDATTLCSSMQKMDSPGLIYTSPQEQTIHDKLAACGWYIQKSETLKQNNIPVASKYNVVRK